MRDCSSATVSPTFTMISVTLTSSPPISGTLTSCTALVVATEAGAEPATCGCATDDAPATSNFIISEPVFTLSPALIRISFTTPACGAGTSIEALSPSTLMMDCSTATLSPTLTRISVTFTSSPPISGTKISTTETAEFVTALCGSALSACGAAASPASNTNIGVPVDTLSPTFTSTSLTTPASGEGTSIEALSPSTLITL